MSHRLRPRNPFAPIRVPAGPGGDAIIDWLCKIFNTTREEAERRGRESMSKMIKLGPVTPKPMKAPVGSIFFIEFDRSEILKELNEAEE